MQWVRPLLLCLSVLTLSACAAYPLGAARMAGSEDVLNAHDVGTKLNWRQTDTPIAVVVVTHGLNLNPDAMNDIEVTLHEAGMDVLALSLTGHENSLEDDIRLARFRQADFQVWQQDMDLAVAQAALRAADQQVPLYLLGFSMGGLLSADHVNRHPDSTVERLVLLAPALSLRWTSYLLMPLSVLPNFFLPSVAPDAYRANNYAPVSAYESLYSGLGRFSEQVEPSRINIPTLVMIDQSDELISPDGVQSFIAEFGLDNWRYTLINKSEGAAPVLSHLIVSRHALGDEAWSEVADTVLAFLNAGAADTSGGSDEDTDQPEAEQSDT